MRSGNRTRGVHRRRVAALLTAGLLAVTPSIADGAAPVAEQQIPFAPVYEDVLAGDLVMAGNSNLLSAGGWRRDRRCRRRRRRQPSLHRATVRPRRCADNSSSGDPRHPRRRTGRRTPGCTSRRHCPRPSARCASASTARPPGSRYTESVRRRWRSRKLAEGVSGVGSVRSDDAPGRVGRHRATSPRPGRVRTPSPTSSTSAPARSCRTRRGRSSPPTSSIRPPTWPSWRRRRRRSSASPAVPCRGTTASSPAADGPVDVPVDGFVVDATVPVFAKSFHVVGHAQHRGAENLLFDGKPIGNNAPPGDAAAAGRA